MVALKEQKNEGHFGKNYGAGMYCFYPAASRSG